MITENAHCETCGTILCAQLPGIGAVCPSCVVRVAQTPAKETPRGAAPTTASWAQVFPQLEIDQVLRSDLDCSVYLATLLVDNQCDKAVLQVVSGAAWQQAGGSRSLQMRAQQLASLEVDGLAPVLDHGDLADAYFLITEAPPEAALVAASLSGRPAGELASRLRSAHLQAEHILQAAHEREVSLRFNPELSFFDAATNQLTLTPSLLPGDLSHVTDPEASPLVLSEGHRIGAFNLVEKLGEGGFGEVWCARQDAPVKRNVALKILKEGFHSRRSRTRFKVEQQALARLEHAHIARFIEGGTTEDGRPYFAMEWIEGTSIARHCHQENASLKERLRLFQQVCQAMQHAHQKGIIHRDLKPSNVMVSTTGADAKRMPTAKVIDFGIARSLNDSFVDGTLLTRADEVIGTPAAMSPEQASGLTGVDLDGRTDVYGLGVLLYEILTGHLPFDPRLPGDELRRQIRQTDPARPSTVVENAPFPSELRGDLDWIVLKCLEKDPDRRYSSAGALLRDLERHGADEPVEAGPPDWGYRLAKFVKRNRVGVVASATVTLALIGGATLATRGFFQAAASEDLARREADTSQAINAFLLDDLLVQADPAVSSNRDLKVIEAVDRAAEKVGERFANQPLVEAEVRMTLATVYAELGDLQNRAVAHAERARELWHHHLGTDHAKTLRAHSLAVRSTPLHVNPMRRLRDLEGILAKQESLSGLLADDTLATLAALVEQQMGLRGQVQEVSGRTGEILKRFRKEFDHLLAQTPVQAKPQLVEIFVRASVCQIRAILPEAEDLQRELATIRKAVALSESQFGAHHTTTFHARIGCALGLGELRRNRLKFESEDIEAWLEEAEVVLRDVIAEATPILGTTHPVLDSAHEALVIILNDSDQDQDEALLELHRGRHELYRSEFGALSYRTITELDRLISASFAVAEGTHDDTEDQTIKAAEQVAKEFQHHLDRLKTRALALAHNKPTRETARILTNLGYVFFRFDTLLRRELHHDALELYQKSITLLEPADEHRDSTLAWSYRRLGEVYRSHVTSGREIEGAFDRSLNATCRALELATKNGQPAEFRRACLEELGKLYIASGRRELILEEFRLLSGDPSLVYWITQQLVALGHFSQAASYWEQFHEHDPKGAMFLRNAALYALMADNREAHEHFIGRLRSEYAEPKPEPESQRALDANMGGHFTYFLNEQNRDRMAKASDLASSILAADANCPSCMSLISLLGEYRSGNLDVVAQTLGSPEFQAQRNGYFSGVGCEFLKALTFHGQGNEKQARTHLKNGWNIMESFFSRNQHHRFPKGYAALSILASEARRKILGEQIPHDHFWRSNEAALIIPESAVRLIDRGHAWRHLHRADGVDPATNDPDFHQTFFTADYDDGHWETGQEDDGPLSGFGYGDPVVVEWEEPEKGVRTSAYLRAHFETSQAFHDLRLRMQVDDGAVIYLDGKEVGRAGIRNGKEEQFGLDTTYRVRSYRENQWISLHLPLVIDKGTHTLAISVHNSYRSKATPGHPATPDLRIGNIVLFGEPKESHPLPTQEEFRQ